MRRLPVLPTIIAAAAVAVMIGLGLWQVQRAAWKERMLAELAVAQNQPAVDLDPLLGPDMPERPIAFRRALVSCSARDAEVSARAGRSLAGASGYAFYVPCRPGEPGWAGRLQVNAGWSQRPDAVKRLSLPATVAGVIGTTEPGQPIILTAAQPQAPLEASAPPRIEDIPNNHLAYAGQWFLFALAAAVIFVLALRRRSVAGGATKP
ncbi:SURF1 family protein [Sphingosinicella sp. YJ22]|uniref:SURF1 family protein n=1 Tax=Sphingosinicella sp. YJ22 TaxID=1104780 RepID=UPI00140D9C82|nr:SURF1 family protein [Sphingosinicella sp. YJ22]